MGPKKDVIDIVTELGGIKSTEDADKLFAERLEAEQLARLNKVKNKAVRLKIANAISKNIFEIHPRGLSQNYLKIPKL